MKNIIYVLVMFLCLSANLQAEWLEEVNAIHAKVRAMTVNPEGLSDEQRLERFYTLSYDWIMLESPGFATYKGDPRGQDRLGDFSAEGIERRRQADRDALAFLDSIDRDALSTAQRDNYDLLRYTLERDVNSQRFPVHYMQMTQMNGPQQDLASLLAMMPNAKPDQLENQIARMEAFPRYIEENIALLTAGMEKGVTPPAITLRDVPQQIRNQLVDDASKSPLLKGFVEVPATVDPLQAESLRKRAEQVYSQQVVPAYEKLLEFTENTYLPGARKTIAARDLPDGEAWYQNNVALMTKWTRLSSPRVSKEASRSSCTSCVPTRSFITRRPKT
jgi:uncharacterized protein (DUF885 family)